MTFRQTALAFALVGSQAAWGAPQLEVDQPLVSTAPYQGVALAHFEAGNSPPFSSRSVNYFWTATVYTILEENENAPNHSYVSSCLYWEVFSTDGPLREILPKIEQMEGLRVLRNDDNADFQVQGAGFVLDISQEENGWKVLQWKIEDTVAAENPSWRKPVLDVEPQAVVIMFERSYDAATLSRDFVRQFNANGQPIDFLRFKVKDSGEVSQTVMDAYVGGEMSKETLTLRTRLKRVRVAGERQYKQLVTSQYFDDGRQISSSDRSELWEVDADGTRRQIR